jgi:hypothetical protein
MRIGETLGLRREDTHFLASSSRLGCSVAGAHVHVRHRMKANGALAKSPFPRTIPVTEDVVELYAVYQHERSARVGVEVSDFVFVNLSPQCTNGGSLPIIRSPSPNNSSRIVGSSLTSTRGPNQRTRDCELVKRRSPTDFERIFGRFRCEKPDALGHPQGGRQRMPFSSFACICFELLGGALVVLDRGQRGRCSDSLRNRRDRCHGASWLLRAISRTALRLDSCNG